jgi:carbonic anhydrase
MCGNCDSKTLSRRHLMAGAGALLAATTVPISRGRAAEPAANALSPSGAFDELTKGHAQYLANEPVDQADYAVDRAARAQAQHPIASILSCSDSRVPTEIIFDQGPGDIFVVRVAGNVVSTYGLASMEFSVAVLGVPLILVLGHTNCGAVASALQSARERSKLPGHLPELVEAIQPAVIEAHGKHPSDLLAAAIRENVRLGMKNLKSQSKIIGDAVSAGKVDIKGGVYDLATGKVEMV